MSTPPTTLPITVPIPIPESGVLDLSLDKSGPIRRFNDSGIQAAVDHACQMVPPGHRFAAMGTLDLTGARAIMVYKPNDEWTVVLAGDSDWSGHYQGELAVRWSK